MNEKASAEKEQNRRPGFSRKGHDKGHEQNDHAERIAAFNDARDEFVAVIQFDARLFEVRCRGDFGVENGNQFFGLACDRLGERVYFKLRFAELVQVHLVQKREQRIREQKLSKEQQKRLVFDEVFSHGDF